MIQKDNEFDSEFCNVKYVEEGSFVLLTWKKFCCFDDYRNPAMFGAELLKRYPESNYIVDARNGFEDEKADIEWGFSVLLPFMAQSDCKVCAFIMNEACEIEGEMDMWTKEFKKYFEVKKVASYQEAVAYITAYKML